MSGPMGLVYPVAGDTTDTWGVVLNTMLGLLENHDHTSGKGSQVPTLGINVNADLSFGAFALTLAKAITFTEQAPSAVTSYSSALFASSVDHNLYWRNSSGTNVQITAGAQLNLSAIGGIGGDYASVSALADFTDATHAYGLHQQIGAGVRQYGKLATGDINLFEFKVNGTAGVPANSVALKSPAALAASYNWTFPTALPASQSMVQVSTAGALTATNTLGNNLNLTLQGTGYVARGASVTYKFPLIPNMCFLNGGTVTQAAGSPGGTVNASTIARFPVSIGIGSGERITKVVFAISSTGTLASMALEYDGEGAGWQPITAVLTNSFFVYTLTVTTPATIASTGSTYVKITTIAGSTLTAYAFQTTTDVP